MFSSTNGHDNQHGCHLSNPFDLWPVHVQVSYQSFTGSSQVLKNGGLQYFIVLRQKFWVKEETAGGSFRPPCPIVKGVL